MTRDIYLDAAASTPIDPVVLEAMYAVLAEVHANPSSPHWAGRRAQVLIDVAREQVSKLGHRGAASVIFLSGSTEANALAIRGLLASPGHRREIVSCVTEHPSVLNVLRALESDGVSVRLVGVDEQGRLDLDELADVVTDQTLLVTVMAANNETGVLVDLEAVAEIAHRAGAFVHTDASQLLAWGALPEAHDLDLITVSGHKMHGPQGIGALIADRHARELLHPVQLGGGQERGLRSGTPNVAGIVGLGHAAERAIALGPSAATMVARLRDYLQAELQARLPVAQVNGGQADRLPGLLNMAFGDTGNEVDADAVLAGMPRIAASTGSACSSGLPGPSPVLLAMGMAPERAQSSIRFSLSRMTVGADIENAVDDIVAAVTRVHGHGGVSQTVTERLVHTP